MARACRGLIRSRCFDDLCDPVGRDEKAQPIDIRTARCGAEDVPGRLDKRSVDCQHHPTADICTDASSALGQAQELSTELAVYLEKMGVSESLRALYGRKVATFRSSLSTPERQPEAAELVRSLVDAIIAATMVVM
jgi:hypothetical protein